MHLTFRNVNAAFQSVVEGIEDQSIPTVKTPSRNGPVLQIVQPVIFTYENPRERVLFNKVRDCNPFFHVYESLWMLAGRNDVAPLDYYMGGKYSQFSDDGRTANGAYGYRWRHSAGKSVEVETGIGMMSEWQEQDQLKLLIEHLKANPNSRRTVLQMWNVENDLLKIDSSKDVACNTAVYFSIRKVESSQDYDRGDGIFEETVQLTSYLDMTVTNRSNDIIWGMFGANAVHFSFLQEYVACALGIEVGHYHQFSNNAHIYTETNSGWYPEKWLAEYRNRTMHSPRVLSYGKGLNDASGNVGTSPKLFAGDETVKLFDGECKDFVEFHSSDPGMIDSDRGVSFLDRTAEPMMQAFHMYKMKKFDNALDYCSRISGADWRVACTNWIQKRKENFEKKGQVND